MKLRLRALAAIVALFAVLTAGQDAAEEHATEPTGAAAAVSEPPVKLVHVLNPGEREYLSPNLIGVQNIAMTFLPLTMNFVNIVDAYREIVDGVRYEIHLNAIDTRDNDADVVCRLVVLEKPWLRTQWGDKVRELTYSNCTSDTDNLTDPAARSDALNDKYQRNALFNGGSRNELSNDEMAKLLSQIVPFSASASTPSTPSASSWKSAAKRIAASTTTTSTTTTTTTEKSKTEYNDYGENDDNADGSSATTVASPDGENTEPEIATAAPPPTPTPATPTPSTSASTEPSVLSEDEMKWLDDIFSVGALNFEVSQRRDVSNQNEAAASAADSVIRNGGDDESNYLQQATIVESAYDDYKQAAQQQQEEDTQRQEMEQEYLEQRHQSHHARAKRGSNALVGGPKNIDVKEAEQRLQHSLDKLVGGPTYRISKIYSASTQVVSGSLTKIEADLIDGDGLTERCHIEIWSQMWLQQPHEVTINCPSKNLLKQRHSRSVEYAEKKTHKKHDHQGLGKVEHLFNKFQTKYNRRYHNSMERQMRLRIFKQNLKMIEDLNHNEMGSAKYGITEFADMTSTEYKERTGLWQREPQMPSKNAPAVIPDVELPKEFDWREKGVISKVKNQGNCGSCWAFSVTGNIEGVHAVNTGTLEEYSEQELLDCDTVDSACNGGLPDNAYQAIQKIGGLELESEYPYEARKDQCHFDQSKVHVKVTGAIDMPKNETAMAQWLIKNGPISIGINANAMQFYRGGVSHPWRPLCSHSNLDHGVLIVGFGVSDYPMFKKTLPYWIVKNSWGPKWGEQGYYRVYRGDNTCGVSEMATSAVLEY